MLRGRGSLNPTELMAAYEKAHGEKLHASSYGYSRLKKLLESLPDVALETDAKNQLRVSLRNARNPRHFDIYEGGSLYRTFLVTIQCVTVAKLLFFETLQSN